MKGIYILLIDIEKGIETRIGKLGKINFKKGSYAYIGSAQNNLRKRVERHFSNNKKKHWHIDYLLLNKNIALQKVFWKKADKQEECKIACFLEKHEEPIKSFGCSDCKCISHLFKLKNLRKINKLGMFNFSRGNNG